MWPIPPHATLWYFLALGVAMLITGIAKSGFGGGVGILAVPLTAAVLPPAEALGTLLPLLIIADIFANLHHLKNRSSYHLRWLLTGGAGGIVAGTALFLAIRVLSPENGSRTINNVLYVVVGGVCLVLVSIQVYRLFGGKVPHISPKPGPTMAVGATAGFVSTLAHSAGPVVNIYLLEQRLDKRLLVGTAAAFFFCINIAKLPTFLALGFTTPGTFWRSLWVVPVIPLGSVVGYWMHKRIPEKPFVVVMYLGAAAAAGHMIYKAFGG